MRELPRFVLGVAIAVLVAALPAAAAAESTSQEVAYGVGSVTTTLVYAPIKASFCILGAGVTVTALSEANVAVRARDEGLSVEEMTRRRNAVIPLGRPNDPEDVAALAVFLASPAARNVTGQSLNVDGGLVFD
jgi:NAD(P)-dependent dehydrogenase (short-subunit alcohol dehydrogenase family)